MTEKSYAFIKDGKVVDLAIFDNPSTELLQQFVIHHEIDEIREATSDAAIGGEWDGESFIGLKPFPSWVLNSDKKWVPPISYPSDGAIYYWNEETAEWIEANISE